MIGSWPARLVIATHNRGKWKEWQTLLADSGASLLCAADLGLPEPQEIASTYLGNARIKAEAVAAAAKCPALADDTGFEVPALAGQPGVQTARFAAEHGGWATATQVLWRQARAAVPDGPIPARLCCAVALATPGRATVTAYATVDGAMSWPPTDAPGFAAIFDCESAVSESEVLVHRRRALAELLATSAESRRPPRTHTC